MSTLPTSALVARIRAKTGQSQEDLAHRIGVSYVTVNSWENARSEPRAGRRRQLDELAAELGIRQGLSVLIIDDDPDAAALAEAYLSRSSYDVDVRTATSGSDGLLLLGSLRPDLVLLDVRMPGIDGFEVAAAMGRVPGLEDVILVFVTGTNEPGLHERARLAGASEVVAKPITRETIDGLLETVARADQARAFGTLTLRAREQATG